MSKVIFDMETMKIISLFQAITHASVKDCISDDNELVFIVGPGELGKAVGKGGANVHRIATALKRKVKIVEFSDQLFTFIKNLIQPLRVENIEEKEGVIILTPIDNTTRGYLIGRGGSSLRTLEERVKRHFPIKEIKVI
jgi:N utilization substance protein A